MANVWPVETRSALDKFYGKHELKADGTPTAEWVKKNIVAIKLPYPMILSWDLGVTVTSIQCHRLVADSLKGILASILEYYGDLAAVKKARMNLYGGAYNYRAIAGSANLSTHAYGAGIDLDPAKNPLGKVWVPNKGMISKDVVAIFEAEGWKWGGNFKNRKDCMHFQATK